jgi:membrane dipeptidase
MSPAELAGQSAVTATLEQIDIVYRMVRKYPDTFELALTADDVERTFKKGRIASLIGMEGGHSIDNSLGALRMFYRAGARYMTLTHSRNTAWADSSTDTPAAADSRRSGKEVVREMNWLGMLVDLSHVSPDTMEDALRVSAAPVVFSAFVGARRDRRAAQRARSDSADAAKERRRGDGDLRSRVSSRRRLPNGRSCRPAEQDRLRQQFPKDENAVKAGVASWASAHPAPRATLADAADHIDHIRKVRLASTTSVSAATSTASPASRRVSRMCSTYPALLAELLPAWLTQDEDVRKIAGLNVLRVMRNVERVSRTLQAERGPSTMLLPK